MIIFPLALALLWIVVMARHGWAHRLIRYTTVTITVDIRDFVTTFQRATQAAKDFERSLREVLEATSGSIKEFADKMNDA